ncbi:MAG: hypothetical protein ACI30C_02995 [Muribaculaceae bacterium]
MKNLLLSICSILAIGTISISLTSCNGCTEEAVSRMYDVDVDLDDDGDYGDRSGQTNVNFRQTGDVKHGDKSVPHTFTPYEHIPDKCKLCGFSEKNGNHY